MSKPLVGVSVPRVEDRRLLTGLGRYVADVAPTGSLHAAFLRSPYPHARITRIDVSPALQVTGVSAAYTGRDLRQAMTTITGLYEAPHLRRVEFDAMAADRVRCVGDLVAVVVADSRYAAEDGCDAIEVEYEELTAVTSIDAALAPGAPAVFDDLGTNVVLDESSSYGDVPCAFAGAHHVVRRTYSQHRQSPSPMEARGGIAVYTPGTGDLTYHASTQNVHMLRYGLSRFLAHPLQRTRATAADTGGAFGQKATVLREDLCLCAVSRLLGRPVAWAEDRRENLLAGGHAREEVMDVELALDAAGRILGLRANLSVDGGAYPAIRLYIAAWIGHMVRDNLPGPYRVPALEFSVRTVTTNKGTYVAYRGPWEVETWVRERLLDDAAAELGIDPVELRLRNLVSTADQPHTTVVGEVLDGIRPDRTLATVVGALDYDALRERQRALRAQGRYLGVGVAGHIEHNGHAGMTERTTVRVELDGTVSILTAQVPHGQSHETTLGQLVADALSVPLESVRMVYGDTDRVPFKVIGTGGSLASTLATGSVLEACRQVREQVARVAAHLLECDPADIDIADGRVMARGAPTSAMTLAQVAEVTLMSPIRIPADMEPALEATATYGWPGPRWTVGTHGCVVEVDLATGHVDIERYVAAVDCGSTINPAVVEGQVRGGIAQGIGGVLYEDIGYGDDGQPRATTFMDYLLPTASEVPPIDVRVLSRPDDRFQPLGIGESGAVLSPATLTNAIADALRPLGVVITEQHLPPARVLELIEHAEARS